MVRLLRVNFTSSFRFVLRPPLARRPFSKRIRVATVVPFACIIDSARKRRPCLRVVVHIVSFYGRRAFRVVGFLGVLRSMPPDAGFGGHAAGVFQRPRLSRGGSSVVRFSFFQTPNRTQYLRVRLPPPSLKRRLCAIPQGSCRPPRREAALRWKASPTCCPCW